MKKKLYCFDFDGTLTTSDTLLEFIRYAKGTGRFLMVFLMYSPLLVLMKLHLFPNWKAKQLIFAHLFAAILPKNTNICYAPKVLRWYTKPWLQVLRFSS